MELVAINRRQITKLPTLSNWEEKNLGELINFEGGAQPPLTTFKRSYKEGYIRLLQIRDYKTDRFETYIPLKYARRFCNENDIMIGRYGPPIFQILRGLKGAYNVALLKAIPSLRITREYLYYFLKQESLFNFIEKLSQRSSGQTGVDLKELKAYSIKLPSLTEQTAIATVLSDTDALIQSLEKLIAKKRNIKQGAMQELLKPKEGWEVKKLGEIAEVMTGNTPPTNDISNYGGEYFFVSPFDLGKGKYILNTEKKLSLKGFMISRRFPKNSILFTCIGSTIGKSGISLVELTSNQQINAILPNHSFSTEFLYYFLQKVTSKIKSSASEQAVPLINKTDFEKIEVFLPSLENQTKIASVFSDMDAEITSLESKLEKYQKIKQGMMQNLLTGKIRLI